MPRKAQRYSSKKALEAATQEACVAHVAAALGCDPSEVDVDALVQDLRLAVAGGAADELAIEDETTALVLRLRDALGEIRRAGARAIRRAGARVGGGPPRGDAALLVELAEATRGILEAPAVVNRQAPERWSDRKLLLANLDRHRRWFWWNGRPTRQDLAVASLLIGNSPMVKLRDGITVAAFVNAEGKAIDDARRKRK